MAQPTQSHTHTHTHTPDSLAACACDTSPVSQGLGACHGNSPSLHPPRTGRGGGARGSGGLQQEGDRVQQVSDSHGPARGHAGTATEESTLGQWSGHTHIHCTLTHTHTHARTHTHTHSHTHTHTPIYHTHSLPPVTAPPPDQSSMSGSEIPLLWTRPHTAGHVCGHREASSGEDRR